MVRAVRELPPPPTHAVKRSAERPLPAPVIRGVAAKAPVLKIQAEEALPQFTLWSDDTSDADVTLKRPSSRPPEISDADVTIPRPSKMPSFGSDDYLDWAPTLKKAGLTPSEAAAVLIAKRFRATTQLSGSDAKSKTWTTKLPPPPPPPKKAKADTLRPVAVSADRTEELDLDEVEELPITLGGTHADSETTPAGSVVELSQNDLADASTELRLDLDDDLPLADSTMEVLALQRRRRVRKMGSRMIAASIAAGVLVLGVGGVRLGARELAKSLELSSIEVTYTSPAVKSAQAAPKPENKPIPTPKPTPSPAPETKVATETKAATPAPKSTFAPTTKTTSTPTTKTTKTTSTPTNAATTKAAPLPPKKGAKFGTLHTPPSAAGHRVYVDGFLSGFAPNPITLKCGTHTVKVGSAAKWQTVNVPCGGDAWAK